MIFDNKLMNDEQDMLTPNQLKHIFKQIDFQKNGKGSDCESTDQYFDYWETDITK